MAGLYEAYEYKGIPGLIEAIESRLQSIEQSLTKPSLPVVSADVDAEEEKE
jgi:hypothetical protein